MLSEPRRLDTALVTKACGACGQARMQAWQGVRSGNVRAVGQAVTRAVAINLDKMRGVNVDQKYGASTPPGTIKATPYRRPPERS